MTRKSEAAAAELMKKAEEMAKKNAEDAAATAKMQAEAQADEMLRQAQVPKLTFLFLNHHIPCLYWLLPVFAIDVSLIICACQHM